MRKADRYTIRKYDDTNTFLTSNTESSMILHTGGLRNDA